MGRRDVEGITPTRCIICDQAPMKDASHTLLPEEAADPKTMQPPATSGYTNRVKTRLMGIETT